jgi:predicted nucleic acid-binding protein
MAFVLDASIALAWFLPDETSTPAQTVLARIAEEDVCAPAIWPLEIASALLTAERRKRISTVERLELLEQLAALPVLLDHPFTALDLPALSDVAREYGLSIYDACYLQLAQSRRIALATLDGELRAAAVRGRVATLP